MRRRRCVADEREIVADPDERQTSPRARRALMRRASGKGLGPVLRETTLSVS